MDSLAQWRVLESVPTFQLSQTIENQIEFVSWIDKLWCGKQGDLVHKPTAQFVWSLHASSVGTSFNLAFSFLLSKDNSRAEKSIPDFMRSPQGSFKSIQCRSSAVAPASTTGWTLDNHLNTVGDVFLCIHYVWVKTATPTEEEEPWTAKAHSDQPPRSPSSDKGRLISPPAPTRSWLVNTWQNFEELHSPAPVANPEADGSVHGRILRNSTGTFGGHDHSAFCSPWTQGTVDLNGSYRPSHHASKVWSQAWRIMLGLLYLWMTDILGKLSTFINDLCLAIHPACPCRWMFSKNKMGQVPPEPHPPFLLSLISPVTRWFWQELTKPLLTCSVPRNRHRKIDGSHHTPHTSPTPPLGK